MGILTRFKDIMSSNINAMLDKAEDPEKMIDQCIRNLQKDLATVKSETAGVMAEQTRAKRKFDECNSEIEKLTSFAKKALEAGNEADARKFLEKKSSMNTELESYKQAFDVASTNANNMKTMHDKLNAQVDELENRRSQIKGKMAAAKTQERMNEMMSSTKGSNSSLDAFARMEEKANSALDKAQAMAELNAEPIDEMADLMSKYGNAPSNGAVDDELSQLKASMGMGDPAVDDELERMKAEMNM